MTTATLTIGHAMNRTALRRWATQAAQATITHTTRTITAVKGHAGALTWTAMACFTFAGFTIGRTLGLIVAGLACLVLEWAREQATR
jgi:hypothetical protein